jgi:hypothetical protein
MKPKAYFQIKLSMALLEYTNHESFLIHGKNVNLFTLHCFIRWRFLILLCPNAFEHLCILNLNCLNHNYTVFIALHLGLYIEKDRPHNACSHAKNLKNMDKSQLNKCEVKNLRCVPQSNLELIPP